MRMHSTFDPEPVAAREPRGDKQLPERPPLTTAYDPERLSRLIATAAEADGRLSGLRDRLDEAELAVRHAGRGLAIMAEGFEDAAPESHRDLEIAKAQRDALRAAYQRAASETAPLRSLAAACEQWAQRTQGTRPASSWGVA